MEKNKKYMIKVELNGRILNYSNAIVTEINDKFVTFIDSHTGHNISYNLNVVVSYEVSA